VADLEDGFVLPAGGYDIIICFNYLHRPLIAQIREALKPGGLVIYETYIVDQARWGKPRNPAHLLQHNELLEMFRGFRVLRYREGIIEESKAMASLVAQKAA
jgi:SAM-dependent methyltransferase